MARAGRKRKPGQREPSGKRQRVYSDDAARRQTAAQRKRYGLRGADLLDDGAGSVLGRAFLSGQITEQQYEAGEEFLRRWVRWAMLSGIPMPTVQALDYSREVRGGYSEGRPSDKQVFAARRRYLELYDRGAGGPGLAPYNLVKVVTVEDCPSVTETEAGRTALAAALQAYVWVFGIAEREGLCDARARGSVRNA